jgi:lipopolysaccharide export system protein LptA
MSGVHRVSVRLLIAAAFAVAAVAAQAQPQRQPAAASPPPASGPPNALQGFSQNRDQPVHIESTTLVVRDKDKVATFSGDVKVVQGDTTMKCKSLVVFYEQDSEAEAKSANKTKTMQAAQPGPGGQQKIKRLEAHGDVVVLQKDQTATGELGTFDMKANTVTLSGGVMMTQGQNVLRGDRLIVDLTTGVSRVESGKNGQGRVQGLFLPGSAGPPDTKGGTGLPGPAVPQAPAPRPGPPARPF